MRLVGEHTLDANGYRILLDARGSKEEHVFVSHAHSDHAHALRGRADKVFSSDETLALAGSKAEKADCGCLPGVGVSLLPSGHMLGSRQLRAECDGSVFTFTGDFKLHESFTAEKAVVKETDYLMIEGTFGNPSHRFPAREEVVESIAKFVKTRMDEGHIVILGGYTLGKSQELVAIVNRL